MPMKELAQLYCIFFRIGAVTFGGGLGMLSLLQQELVEKRQWITEAELTDFYAIGLCTPGVIAVNVATMAGIKRKGIPGGAVATMGFITMPLVSVLALSMVLQQIVRSAPGQAALEGMQAFVCFLIGDAIIKLWKGTIKSTLAATVFGLMAAGKLLCVMLDIQVSVLCFLGAAALAGLVLGKRGTAG